MATQIFTSLSEETFKELLIGTLREALSSRVETSNQQSGRDKKIFTRQETAKLLSISLPTLHEYTKQGLIVSYRLGTKVRYRLEDIEKALIQINSGRRNNAK